MALRSCRHCGRSPPAPPRRHRSSRVNPPLPSSTVRAPHVSLASMCGKSFPADLRLELRASAFNAARWRPRLLLHHAAAMRSLCRRPNKIFILVLLLLLGASAAVVRSWQWDEIGRRATRRSEVSLLQIC